jgi:hypothetical protein
MRRGPAIALLLVSCVAAAALLGIERSSGAAEFGTRIYVSPCTAPPDPFPESGFDAALQRIALSALNGAACELGTTREELILSLAPGSGFETVQWDDATRDRAVRVGLRRAIDDADERDSLPGLAARLLRVAVDKAPIGWLLDRLGVTTED